MGLTLSTVLTISSVAAAGASIAGGVIGIAGAVQQHEQAKANAEAQEKQARYNQRLEQIEAARVDAETAENARRQREAAEKMKAQQRALLGKSGAAMTSGSPLAILGQTAFDQEQRIRDVHYAGYREAQQHTEAAKMYDYQARVARAQRPSSASLGLAIAGQAINTTGSLAQIGGNYITGKSSLAASGMGNKPLWG